jgi:hypothetical protein
MSSNSKSHRNIHARTQYPSLPQMANCLTGAIIQSQCSLTIEKSSKSERSSSTIFAFPCTARMRMDLFASATFHQFFLLVSALRPNGLEIASLEDDHSLFSHVALR